MLPPAAIMAATWTRTLTLAPALASVKPARAKRSLTCRRLADGLCAFQITRYFSHYSEVRADSTRLQILQNQWFPCETRGVAADWGEDAPIAVGRKIAVLAVTKNGGTIDA